LKPRLGGGLRAAAKLGSACRLRGMGIGSRICAGWPWGQYPVHRL